MCILALDGIIGLIEEDVVVIDNSVLRHWYGRNRCGTQDGCYGTITDPSQGLSWSLGAVYIDVSFP